MFASLTQSSVTCSCDPPPQYSRSSKLIKYILKYRKQVERDWTFMPETEDCHQTVTELDDASVYDFTVAAKYDGGDLGPDAEPTAVTTDNGISSTVSLAVVVVLVAVLSTASYRCIDGQWTQKWLLSLNIKKCNVVAYSRNVDKFYT